MGYLGVGENLTPLMQILVISHSHILLNEARFFKRSKRVLLVKKTYFTIYRG